MRSELERLLLAVRAVRPARLPAQERPTGLPVARRLEVPGRGAFFVRDSGGAGPVLVLLHPWTWTADLAFAAVFAALARDHRVLCFDQRGHGRGPSIVGRLELVDLVHDLLGVLDASGVGAAFLVGHSLGGLVAMRTAQVAPARVAGLVVSGAAACYRTLRRDRWVWRLLHLATPLARRGHGRSLPLRYFRVSAFRQPALWRRWRWLEDELAAVAVADLCEVGRMVGALDLRPTLAGRPRPPHAAYIVLEQDTICDPRLQRAAAVDLAATVFSLPGDHDVLVVSPERYLETLRAALARVGAAD